MIEYKTRLIPQSHPEKITCDRCKKEFDASPNCEDVFETQEFHYVNFIGGYSSVFGDGAHVQADICQKCLFELIKDFARISYTE